MLLSSFLSMSNFLALIFTIKLSVVDASPISSDLSERGGALSTLSGTKLLGYTYVVKGLADEFNAAKTITSTEKAVEGNRLQEQITESGYATVYAEPSTEKTQTKAFPNIWVCTINVAKESTIRKELKILRVAQNKLSPWKSSTINSLFKDKALKAKTLLFPLPETAQTPSEAHTAKVEVTGELLIPGALLVKGNPLGISADCVELSKSRLHQAADWTDVLGVSIQPTKPDDPLQRYTDSQVRYHS